MSRARVVALLGAILLGAAAMPRATPAAPCRADGRRCTCADDFTGDSASTRALRGSGDVIAEGRVLSVAVERRGWRAPSPVVARIVLETVWQGIPAETVAVVDHVSADAWTTCDIGFERDSTYLLVLRADGAGRYQTGMCMGTRYRSAADRIVAALGAPRWRRARRA